MPKKPGSGRKTKKTTRQKKTGKKKAPKKVGIFDAKTIVKKKPRPKKAKPAKKEKINLAFKGSRAIKKLCNEAVKSADPNQKTLLDVEFRALFQISEPHRENPDLAKLVRDEGNWGHIAGIFNELRYAENAKAEIDRDTYTAAAKGLTYKWLTWLKWPRNKLEPLFKILYAEYEARKTKKVIFGVLKQIWGEKFTKRYLFETGPAREDLPELDLRTRRFPPKKKE